MYSGESVHLSNVLELTLCALLSHLKRLSNVTVKMIRTVFVHL